jgi:hypothetical protein
MHDESSTNLLGEAALAPTNLMLDGVAQRALAELRGKRLARLHARLDSAELLCRLCDRSVCVADATCPVDAEECAENQQ